MTGLLQQYQYNVGKGAFHRTRAALPAQPPETHPLRLIAYYLPQFHRVAENDDWWGTGFTEWTNVAKALPRYRGHYQPRMPADLGFYDLASAATLERQAELAALGGLYGFCIHHYWFGGRRILETPLNVLLANPAIKLRFCLNWANENWTRRWDGSEHEILLRQNHSAEDDLAFAASIAPALADERYIRIDGRPLLMVYRPAILPDMRATADRWREFFVRRGLGDPFLVMAQTFGDSDPRAYGLDAAAGFPPHNTVPHPRHPARRRDRFDRAFAGSASCYEALARGATALRPDGYRLFPGVCPDWDNEPRKPGRGDGLVGSTPAKYGAWLRRAGEYALQAPSAEARIVFVNAWNEWAEGAYLEPDRHHGYAYLAETAAVLAELGGAQAPRPAAAAPPAGFGPSMRGRRSMLDRVSQRLARARRRSG